MTHLLSPEQLQILREAKANLSQGVYLNRVCHCVSKENRDHLVRLGFARERGVEFVLPNHAPCPNEIVSIYSLAISKAGEYALELIDDTPRRKTNRIENEVEEGAVVS